MLTEKTKIKVRKVLLLGHKKRKQEYREILEFVRTTKVKNGRSYEKKRVLDIVLNLVSSSIASFLGWVLKR